MGSKGIADAAEAARTASLANESLAAIVARRPDRFAGFAERIRSERVAYDLEEHTDGICAAGAIISDPYGPIAAISVPVPAQRFLGNEQTVVQSLLRACDDCSAALGA